MTKKVEKKVCVVIQTTPEVIEKFIADVAATTATPANIVRLKPND